MKLDFTKTRLLIYQDTALNVSTAPLPISNCFWGKNNEQLSILDNIKDQE